MRWPLAMLALVGIFFATPVMAATPEQCAAETIQAMAPADTTVAFAAREQNGCRVSGYVTTTNPGPNRVLFMLVLPDNFNGRYLYLGVGGAAGSLPTPSAALLRAGYAIAGSDAGTGPRAGADFNFGAVPGRDVDFLWRGVHVSAQATQQITRAFYHRESMYRYISGCSGGGQMGFTSAFRFGRDDFDGFLVGAIQFPGPAAYMPQLYRIAQHVQAHPESWISPQLLARAQAAIIQRYDDTDGASDGVIADPRNIADFDESILTQVGFTPAQIETFNLITNPPRLSRTPGNPAATPPGFPISSIANWSSFLLGSQPPPWRDTTTTSAAELLASGAPYMHVMIDSRTRESFPGRAYTDVTNTADLMRVATREGRDNLYPTVDVFSRVRESGARMIYYHGVNDPNQPFYNMVNGYQAVRARYRDANSWLHAYGVPGMLHCRGGDGPTDVEAPLLDALVAWVERGEAPDSVVAPRQTPARGLEREFLLCPEPRRAYLRQQGLDATRAENWACRAPRR